MSTRLPMSLASRRWLVFLPLCIFLSHYSVAQVTAPTIRVRQGLPANNDWYQNMKYVDGYIITQTLNPSEFFYSTDGVNWNRVPEPPELGYGQPNAADAYQVPDITHGAGQWVIVGDSGRIFSSPDLVNWTRHNVGTQIKFNGVDYVDSLFLAMGDSATLFGSPDGTTWTRQTINGSNPAVDRLTHAVYGNGALIVNSNSFDNTGGNAYRSGNGVAGPWLQVGSQFGWTTKFFNGKFYRPNGSSTDGLTWQDFAHTYNVTDVFADSSKVYVIGDTSIQTGFGSYIFPGILKSSSDGVNFGPSTILSTDCTHGLYAAGRYFVYFRCALGSTDATNWYMQGSYGPTATTDGKVFVKVSPTQGSENPTPGPAYISTSTDFIHWTPVDTVATGLDAVLHDSVQHQFEALGPTTYTSTSGGNWAALNNPPLYFADENFRATYGGGTFVAWWSNTPNNYVWYSKDGVNWSGVTMPPPTPEEFLQGATSAVMEITNVQYINGRFWMFNSSAGGTPASIFTSTDGTNFSTPGMNNTFAGNFQPFSYDQMLYVPDSNKYYIFGLGAVGTPQQLFFTTSTPDPTDSSIVLTDHTNLTGNLKGVSMYNGENIAYGDPNFADPGGFTFAYNNGHFVGGAVGGGNGLFPTPPFSYLMWSSDGATWDGLPVSAYTHLLSNLASSDSFRIEGWNNFEILATYPRSILPPPDSLLQFNAVVMNHKSVLLTWSASTGGDTREFVIQRSTPSSAWVTLDSVPVASQDTGTASYRYVDRSPVKGLNDYRLLIENQDGSSSFSPVRQVQIHGQIQLALFPNPVQSQLIVLSDPAITANVSLYSSDGKLVRQQMMTGTKLFMNMADLPMGAYHLVVRQPDGTQEERDVMHVE